MKKEISRNAQIKEAFNKTLSLYPTKNLEDFYDKEGFRDQEFDKGDKGTWIINSGMNIQLKGESLKSRDGSIHKSQYQNYKRLFLNKRDNRGQIWIYA